MKSRSRHHDRITRIINVSLFHSTLYIFICAYTSNICKKTLGNIFLGTPHKGSNLTTAGKLISLRGYWKGSSTSLLDIIEPGSVINRLHDNFMVFLSTLCGVSNTVCVFEAAKKSFYGLPITHVSGTHELLEIGIASNSDVLQVVDKDSAVIDGPQKIGSEKGHRDIQRFRSREYEDYQDLLVWIRRWLERRRKASSVTVHLRRAFPLKRSDTVF